MPTFTKFSALALTIAFSVSTTLAQTPVRRTATKTAVRPRTTSATRVAPTPVRKPVATAAAVPTVQAAPAQAAPAPVVARQTEPQPVTHAAPVRSRSSAARSGRHVYLNAGVGLATYYGGGFPIGVSVEADVKNNFSVGGSIDYYHYNYGYYSGGYNFIYAGARGSYHLGEALNVQSSNFDPYIGATLGFRYAGNGGSYYSYYDGYSSSYNSGLYVGIHVGARVLFTPKVGAFAEVGYGVSAVKLGLAAKF